MTFKQVLDLIEEANRLNLSVEQIKDIIKQVEKEEKENN